MDEEGLDWCKDNLDVISEWMREEAAVRRIPFSKTLAKLVVLRAIRNARKKLRRLRS
jgi:hypothetical protein